MPRKGEIIDRIGEENINNFGSKIIIIRCRGSRNIDVYFPEYDWIFENADYKEFKNRKIKCPYEPRVYGVGYMGEGKYNSIEKGKKHNHIYSTWSHMMRRCYNKKYQIKNPTYKRCKVCNEWLNFQNFARWYEENYYEIDNDRMCLDKDILMKGNKIYSPDTCVFVSNRINCLFTKTNKHRGKYPVGVYYKSKNKKFASQCSEVYPDGHKQQVYLGLFDKWEDAFYAYKTHKESYIKQIANEHRNIIPEKLYAALYNYKVEIND